MHWRLTSFDLIIGLLELGLNNDLSEPESRLAAFGKELVYLFDNHLALGALLILPRILMPEYQPDATETSNIETKNIQQAVSSGFLGTLDPPLTGRIYWIEAQEHYVRISTTAENRMVLLRFTDAVREISSSEGMQVHRSHWVAFPEFQELVREGQNVKLKLTSDELVPVSRSYRQQVEDKFQQLQIA